MSMTLAEALLSLASIKNHNKLEDFEPYPYQRKFYAAGKDNPERMLMAGNRVGKTIGAAAEVAFHTTGLYPDWWEGKRFPQRVYVWTGAQTNEASRDIVQKALIGGLGEDFGTGLIPLEKLEWRPQLRQCGIQDVVDSVKVRHKRGGISTIQLKTYEQGWKKWQGTEPHVVWLDEEPDDYRIYTEAMTRTLTSKGIVMVTFTPLEGETKLVDHFIKPQTNGIFWQGAEWKDAPHINTEEAERLLASYPDYERRARTKGIPMLGSGRVFGSIRERISSSLRSRSPSIFQGSAV